MNNLHTRNLWYLILLQYTMSYSKEDLEKHLKEEHRQSPFSEYLKEIVYGGADGIVTTFAVVAGFAGAGAAAQIGGLGTLTVLLFGLANLFGDASSMALGNFLSIRSEQDRYKKEEDKEFFEIKHNPNMEKAESVEIMKQQGFDQKAAQKLVDIYATNEKYWVSFMMKYELEMANPFDENPYFTAVATFMSFIFFGTIPLIPYLIDSANPNGFILAITATILALFLLGILRLRVTKQSAIRSVGEIVLIGGVSAVIAYIVGTFFRI